MSSRARRRHQDQDHRRRRTVAVLLVATLLLILAGPALLSFCGVGSSAMGSWSRERGLTMTDGSLRVGWITPLRIRDAQFVGSAGSVVEIAEVETPVTLLDWMRGRISIPPQAPVRVRGVQVHGALDETGASSLALDLAPLMVGDDDGGSNEIAVELQDAVVELVDEAGQPIWAIRQAAGTVVMVDGQTDVQMAALVESAGGPAGSASLTLTSWTDTGDIDLSLRAEALPLSIAELVPPKVRPDRWPTRIAGDATGEVRLHVETGGETGGEATAEVGRLIVRDLAVQMPVETGKTEVAGEAAPPTWRLETVTIDGDVRIDEHRLIARGLRASSDFATMTFDGSLGRTVSWTGRGDHPLRWLQSVDGRLEAVVDLAKAQRALPGMLPIRDGIEITGGEVQIDVAPAQSSAGLAVDEQPRRLSVALAEVVAQDRRRGSGGSITLPPADAVAVVRMIGEELIAEEFRIDSPYLTADGHGSLSSGTVRARGDFGRLASAIESIVDLPVDQINGRIDGDIRWQTDAAGRWQLDGGGLAEDLRWTLPGGERLIANRLRATISSLGRLEGDSLLLQRGGIELSADDLTASVELTRPTNVLDGRAAKPLRIRASGELLAAAGLADAWWPTAAQPMTGQFDFQATADALSDGSLAVHDSTLRLDRSAWRLGDTELFQQRIDGDFGGLVDFSRGVFRIDAANIVGETASAGLHGVWAGTDTDLEIAWRLDLGRLKTALSGRPAAGDRSPFRPASAVSSDGRMAEAMMSLVGVIDGRTVVTRSSGIDNRDIGNHNIEMRHELQASDVTLLESTPPAAGGSRTLWSESDVRVEGLTVWQPDRQLVLAEPIQIRTQTLSATLDGHYAYTGGQTDVRLRGPVEASLRPLSTRVSHLAGTSIVADGIHRGPVEIAYAAAADGRYAFNVEASIGWDRLTAGGMRFGPAIVPLAVNETRVRVAPVDVSVLPEAGRGGSQPTYDAPAGSLRLAGDLVYRPGLRVELPAGPLARDIELTPQLTAAWLQYLAPIASDAAEIQGRFGLDVDAGVVDLDDARGTRLAGRLGIDGVQMRAGPLANQTIAAARQIQSLLAIGTAMVPPAGGQTLVTLPPQTVDFSVTGGDIDHRALRLMIGQTEVITGGRVSADGRLNLTAQVPLRAKWLGNDLRQLVGQSMTLPVTGTLQQPRLQTEGIRRVVADLGVQAATGAAENYLQGQLDRGLDKLFGR